MEILDFRNKKSRAGRAEEDDNIKSDMNKVKASGEKRVGSDWSKKIRGE